jgi:hypothetical protein
LSDLGLTHIPSYIVTMKATIEFDDALYRRLKVEAARRGRTIRDLVDEGVRVVLSGHTAKTVKPPAGEWYASLRRYADHAGGEHDMSAVRGSIARKRSDRK